MINFNKKIELDILYTFSAIRKENFLYLMDYLYHEDRNEINFHIDNYLNHSKVMEQQHIINNEVPIDFYTVKGFSQYSNVSIIANNILIKDSFKVFMDYFINSNLQRYDVLTNKGNWIEVLSSIPSRDVDMRVALKKYKKLHMANSPISYDASFLKNNMADIVMVVNNKLVAISDLDSNLSAQALEYVLFTFAYASYYDKVILVLSHEPSAGFITNLKKSLELMDISTLSQKEIGNDEPDLYDEYTIVKNRNALKETVKNFSIIYYDSRNNKTHLKLRDLL